MFFTLRLSPSHTLCLFTSVLQSKVSVEKAKIALESERSELQIELQSVTQSKNDSESRRKKAEAQLQELQLKHGESEKQKKEMAEKMSKMQVINLTITCCTITRAACARGNYSCFICVQLELEGLSSTLSEVESKSIKATKECSSVESQLQDTQVTHNISMMYWNN